jgi:hypothetical protein
MDERDKGTSLQSLCLYYQRKKVYSVDPSELIQTVNKML